MPQSGSGFGGEDAVAAAEGLLREIDVDPMPAEAALDHQLLAVAVRLAKKERVHVIDFGGGVGQSYAALKRMTDVALQYEVVDLPPLAARGTELWKGVVDFRTELGNATPDVLFIKSAVQYFDDYAALLDRLFYLGAQFILFEKFSGTGSRTYATLQVNVYESRIPYWFISIDELTERARNAGYRVVIRRRLDRIYDQSNFPPELRMGQASSILFERT
jgi:putative methyltransferase (TIGR04325 family)